MSKNEDLKKNELSLDDLEQASGGVVREKDEIVNDRFFGKRVKTSYEVVNDKGEIVKTFGSGGIEREKADAYNQALVDNGIIKK